MLLLGGRVGLRCSGRGRAPLDGKSGPVVEDSSRRSLGAEEARAMRCRDAGAWARAGATPHCIA